MLAAILLAVAAPVVPLAERDPGDAPVVPAEAQAAFGAYIDCLYDPLETATETGEPHGEAGRALVQKTLAECGAVRATSLAEMEAKIPRTGAWADPAYRSRETEWILLSLEERVAFAIVDRDQFLAIADTVRKCVAANGGDRCADSAAMRRAQ